MVEDGAVALSGLAIQAGGPRAALKVLGGRGLGRGVVARRRARSGPSSTGAGSRVATSTLAGGYGLLLRRGEVSLAASRARGAQRGPGAARRPRLELRQLAVDGPLHGGRGDHLGRRAPRSRAWSSVTPARPGSRSWRAPGSRRADWTSRGPARWTAASWATASRCCAGTLRLDGERPRRAAEAPPSRRWAGTLRRSWASTHGRGGRLPGASSTGPQAELDGNRCSGRGPAVVSAGGAQVSATMNRWRADPVFWVECARGRGSSWAWVRPCGSRARRRRTARQTGVGHDSLLAGARRARRVRRQPAGRAAAGGPGVGRPWRRVRCRSTCARRCSCCRTCSRSARSSSASTR